MQNLVDSAQPSIQLYDFQAFQCTNCGRCCGKPWRVNIDSRQLSAITGSQAYKSRAREGFLPLQVDDDGLASLGRKEDGMTCTFFDPTTFCSIHAELGGQAKPLGCQLFPYQKMETPDSTYFSLSFACPPVVAGLDVDAEANRRELSLSMANVPARVGLDGQPFMVQASQDRAISWAGYLQLEARILEAFVPAEPTDSVLRIILSICRLLDDEASHAESWQWPALLAPAPALEDVSFPREMIAKYLGSIVSALEDEPDRDIRESFARQVEQGQPVSSQRFGMDLPPLKLEAPTEPWILETYRRYFQNAVLGKSLLKKTVLARLLSTACAPILVSYFAEAYRCARGEEEVNLQALIDAYELVESYIVTHTGSIDPYFADLENMFARIARFDIEWL